MQWNTGYNEGIHSFANNIATTEGGMHEEGFKRALTNVDQPLRRGKGLLKEKEDNLLGEDIREGLTAIMSVKLPDPQFEGQTKAKLGNTEIRSLVEKATNEQLGRVARGAPRRGQAHRAEVAVRREGPYGRQAGPRPHAADCDFCTVRLASAGCSSSHVGELGVHGGLDQRAHARRCRAWSWSAPRTAGPAASRR